MGWLVLREVRVVERWTLEAMKSGCGKNVFRRTDTRAFYRVAQTLAQLFCTPYIALPNINRFSKLFHYQNQEKILR